MFRNTTALLKDGYIPDGNLLVKTVDSVCVGVYHLGRWPEVFPSCHYRNGQSWNIRYRAITIKVSNPISFIQFRLGGLFREIGYSIKSYLAVYSGFAQMESRYDGEWGKAEIGEDPFYICALFNNGRHIPLPILDDWEYDEHKLQKWAIHLAGGAPEAIKACDAFMPKSRFWIADPYGCRSHGANGTSCRQCDCRQYWSDDPHNSLDIIWDRENPKGLTLDEACKKYESS